MKKFVLLLLISVFFMMVNIKIIAQNYIFDTSKVFRYFAATSEPDANWYKPGFEDTNWISDKTVVGFGESAIPRPVSHNAKSIYARFAFNITNKSAIKAMNFSPDYDDGYIAYLNGHEIARVNVDKFVKFPAYNALASRSHENELLTGNINSIFGVYLDSLLLDSCLVNGENMMAVHVLNDSVNGSDMVYIPILFNLTGANYNIYDFASRYKGLVDIDSSSLPIVFINTNEFGIPGDKNVRITASMGIIDNGPGKYNFPTDIFNIYNGMISIGIRGQSSRDFPKQQYRIQLKGNVGNDTSAVILGMPEDNDWILYGPFTDKSQIRNKFVFDLGSRLGHYQPRSRFCELILNGQLVGLYAFTENIKRGKNRVDVAKMKNTDIDGVDVTGGYIFKYDKNDYNTQELAIIYPKADSIQPEQQAYFNSFMKRYDSALSTNKFIDPGFRKYIDDSTLVDYLIMNELSKNADAYLYSTYLYKDRDDRDKRVKYGPLWDYDLGFGNTSWQHGNTNKGWQWDEPGNQTLKITKLLQDTGLVYFLNKRWYSLRDGILSDESLFEFIDSLTNYIKDARIRNYKVWPVINKNPWLYNQTYFVSDYDEEISYLKNWIAARTNWMDKNMRLIFYPLILDHRIPEPGENLPQIYCAVYPNPFIDKLILEFNTEQNLDIRLEFSNILGQTKYVMNLGTKKGYQKIDIFDQQISKMPKGIYLLRIFYNNSLVTTLKIIKN